ncbi:unnamed protein product, partial [Ixodes pacificus]
RHEGADWRNFLTSSVEVGATHLFLLFKQIRSHLIDGVRPRGGRRRSDKRGARLGVLETAQCGGASCERHRQPGHGLPPVAVQLKEQRAGKRGVLGRPQAAHHHQPAVWLQKRKRG